MQNDDLIRRNQQLLEEAQAVRETTRELVAEAAVHQFSARQGSERIRKALQRALWRRSLRLYPAGAHPI